MSQLPQPWLSYRRQCQQTLHPTSAHSDCEQSLQPIDWQGQPAACLPGGSGPKDVYTSGGFMGHVVHLPPIPQHPRTPGHKAFRSQLTANELGGIRFAGVGSKWSAVQPRSARANLLWQPRALGIWGRYLPTKIPHLSGTPDAHGSDLQLMSPPGTSRKKASHYRTHSNGGSWASTYKLSTGEERNAPRLRRSAWLWTGSSLANAVLEADP